MREIFASLLGNDYIKGTLAADLVAGKAAHGYILSGPDGCGKKTAARLIAAAEMEFVLEYASNKNYHALTLFNDDGSVYDNLGLFIRGGNIDGNRFAIIDLPEPGLPTSRILCPPAHATSRARFTIS